jgi:hypothetical protein
MHCEDLLVDDSSDRETIEAICKGFPQFDVISAFACRKCQGSGIEIKEHGGHRHSS